MKVFDKLGSDNEQRKNILYNLADILMQEGTGILDFLLQKFRNDESEKNIVLSSQVFVYRAYVETYLRSLEQQENSEMS